LTYLSSTNVANPIFNGVQKGTFKYRVAVTNLQTGCSKTDDITIVVDKPVVPTANFWAKLSVTQQITASATGGFGSNSFSWSPATFLSSASISNPMFNAASEGDYSYMVSVTDQQGCIGTGQVSVNASSARGNLVAKAEAYERISLLWQDRSD